MKEIFVLANLPSPIATFFFFLFSNDCFGHMHMWLYVQARAWPGSVQLELDNF